MRAKHQWNSKNNHRRIGQRGVPGSWVLTITVTGPGVVQALSARLPFRTPVLKLDEQTPEHRDMPIQWFLLPSACQTFPLSRTHARPLEREGQAGV